MRTIQRKLAFFRSIGYFPHDRQLAAHEALCNHRFVTVAAGARAGKSMLGGAEILDVFLQPGTHTWCVSSQYSLAEKEFDWFLQFLAAIHTSRGLRLSDVCRISSAARGSRACHAPWGSWVVTKSAEKPSGLLGDELDLIVMGEASQIARTPWDRYLSMRIVSRRGKVLAISTPNSDSGLFVEFFQKGQDKGESDYWSSRFSSYENPTLDPEELEAAKLRMTDINYREQVLGEFVSRLGQVFELSDEHFVDELPEEAESWPTFIGIRPAQNNPFVVAFIKVDYPNKKFWVYDELYIDNPAVTSKEVAKECQNRLKGHLNRGKITDAFAKSWREDMERCGFRCAVCEHEEAIGKKAANVQRIQFLQNILKSPTNLVFVESKTRQVVKDFCDCKWPESREEDGKSDSETPLDRYLGGPFSVCFPLAWIERRMRGNIYAAQ